MNAGPNESMQRRTRAAAGAMLAGCVTALAGCADLGRVATLDPPPVNPESPVAGRVQAAADRDYPYPSFRDVPSVPKDLPSPGQVKSQVVDLVQTRRAQERWVAANPPMSTDGEAFASGTQGQFPSFVRDIPPPDQAARTDALAAQMRAAAAPPPSVGGDATPLAPPTPPAYLPAPGRQAVAPPAAKRKRARGFKLPPPPASAPGKRPG